MQYVVCTLSIFMVSLLPAFAFNQVSPSIIAQAHCSINHGLQEQVTRELSEINKSVRDSTPSIERNINATMNSLQEVFNAHDVYDYEGWAESLYNTMEASFEADLLQNPSSFQFIRAKLHLLKRFVQFAKQRPHSVERNDRMAKLFESAIFSLCGVTFSIPGHILVDDVLKRSNFYGYSLADRIGGLVFGSLFIVVGLPFIYMAAKRLKRAAFFGTHLKNRVNCLEQLERRLELLTNNIERLATANG